MGAFRTARNSKPSRRRLYFRKRRAVYTGGWGGARVGRPVGTRSARPVPFRSASANPRECRTRTARPYDALYHCRRTMNDLEFFDRVGRTLTSYQLIDEKA